MFKTILFPTDFSRHADKILDCVPDLVQAGMGRAVLLHVINPMKAARWISVDEAVIQRLHQEANSKLLDITMGLADKYRIRAKFRVEIGSVHQEIIKVADEEAASLIIMESRGRRYFWGALLGTNTEKVLRHTGVPLLIERFRMIEEKGEESLAFISKKMFKKILYPTDFSNNAFLALQMIKEFHKAGTEEIIVVHIQYRATLIPHLTHKMEDFNRIDWERLEEIEKQLRFFGYRVKKVLRTGIPCQEINQITQEEDASMIVMGAHGKSAIKEAMTGCVAASMAINHVRPLMVIPSTWKI